MANEFILKQTGEDTQKAIDNALNAVLHTPQTLTEEQKAQVRLNIGVVIKEDGVVTKDVTYTYDGDDESDEHTWILNTGGNKAFVKVADIPDGEINLVGSSISVAWEANSSLDYSFEITEDMLTTSVDYDGWILPAKVTGLTQILHKGANDATLIAVALICTRAGRYAIAFNGWGEELTIPEKGIYFMDNRSYGGSKYAVSMDCTVTFSEEAEETPIECNENEIQVFTRGICIGDSITEGVFNHSDGEVTIKKYSYPNILKKITGIEIVNAGVAGLTSKTWYEASINSDSLYGTWVNDEWVWHMAPDAAEGDVVSKSLDYSGFDFAVIHLGINDIGMMGDATLDETVSTFETNIHNIVNKLKTANSGIKIFLATIIPCYASPGNSAYETLNEKIREIASTTDDVYLIDLNQYSELHNGTAYENSHLTAVGYRKMATEIKSLINYTIHNNLADFESVQFIGTDYTM